MMAKIQRPNIHLPAPQRVARGRFRFTLTGFTCERETNDHILEVDGKGDEVYFLLDRAFVDANFNVLDRRRIRSVNFGDINNPPGPARVQAGSRSDRGGLRSGDHHPTSEPWRLLSPPAEDRIPWLLGEFDLAHGEGAAVFILSLWEWDGNEDLQAFYNQRLDGWWASFQPQSERTTDSAQQFANVRNNAIFINSIPEQFTSGARDYPIGLRRGGWDNNVPFYNYCPVTLVMNYEEALRISQTSNGRDLGVIDATMEDWFVNVGRYTFHIKVERVG